MSVALTMFYPSVSPFVREVPVLDENGLTFFCQFLPRSAMHKRGLCRHAVSVCLSVCLCVCHVRELRQNE